jgi:hypothetical protein
MKRLHFFLAAGMLVAPSIGCWQPPSASGLVDRAVNRTVDSAADRVGERIGEQIAASMLASNPELMYGYSMAVFSALFYHGGYYFNVSEYQPGQWTQWKGTGYSEGDMFEKTLLNRRSDGSEWWRVETRSNSNGKTEVVVMEALFSPPEEATGTRRVLRMRALLPGDSQPREIAVTEQNSRSWVMSGNRTLTEESMEGMKVGTESVETPAGTFTADHLRSGDAAGSSSFDWWIGPEKIPGQMIKWTRSDSNGEVYSSTVLVGYGDGQTQSKLGIDVTAEPAADAGASGDGTPEAAE